LYLYHELATHFAARIPHLNTPLFIAATISIAIFIASCSYHFIEKPFLALKAKGVRSAQALDMSLASPKPTPAS
jgi:peptidoglycan/LPS O-acetylase OafA/YrhL